MSVGLDKKIFFYDTLSKRLLIIVAIYLFLFSLYLSFIK